VPDEAALTVEGLCAGYGRGDILHDVSFTVPEGGITCIVGPNGAGKLLENGRVRLAGSGREVLENPEIGALYLGGGTGTASGSAVLP
jgi:ABC-type enterochelin transport system ATPase subunit